MPSVLRRVALLDKDVHAGAILDDMPGDMIDSRFEGRPHKSTDFPVLRA